MKLRLLALTLAAAMAVAAVALAGVQQFPTRFAQLGFKASAEKIVFKGTLASAEEKCVKGRTAKLKRKHNGKTKTLASDESDGDGDFKIKVEDPPVEGKFYGAIKRRKLNSGAICLERETASLTITVN